MRLLPRCLPDLPVRPLGSRDRAREAVKKHSRLTIYLAPRLKLRMEIATAEEVRLVFASEDGSLYFKEAFDLLKSRAAALPAEAEKGCHLSRSNMLSVLRRHCSAGEKSAGAKKSDSGARHKRAAGRKKCQTDSGSGGDSDDSPAAPSADKKPRRLDPEGEKEWSLAAIRKHQPEDKSCICGRKVLWLYYIHNSSTGAVLGIGEYCLRNTFPALLGDARTLKHYYRTAVCYKCLARPASSDWLCEDCAEQAEHLSCEVCGRSCAVSGKFRKHRKCIDCWRRDQLERSDHSCPHCGQKIPLGKTWWAMCYGCFLKDKKQPTQVR